MVNLDCLTQTSSSRVYTVSDEMRQMGEFILLTAQAGVRQGSVMDEILAMCEEIRADVVAGAIQEVGLISFWPTGSGGWWARAWWPGCSPSFGWVPSCPPPSSARLANPA